MKQTPLTSALERLQARIERIGDPTLRTMMSDVFNLFEDMMADNAALRQERQRLRDEVNRLKGEQGKPEIRPTRKTPSKLSSEQERKHAEREAEGEVSREGFKLDTPSVEKLKEHRIPAAVLDQFTGLHGKRYADAAEFLRDVESVVGAETTQQYQSLLLKYARYRTRRRPPQLADLTIDREEICPVDASSLPPTRNGTAMTRR